MAQPVPSKPLMTSPRIVLLLLLAPLRVRPFALTVRRGPPLSSMIGASTQPGWVVPLMATAVRDVRQRRPVQGDRLGTTRGDVEVDVVGYGEPVGVGLLDGGAQGADGARRRADPVSYQGVTGVARAVDHEEGGLGRPRKENGQEEEDRRSLPTPRGRSPDSRSRLDHSPLPTDRPARPSARRAVAPFSVASSIPKDGEGIRSGAEAAKSQGAKGLGCPWGPRGSAWTDIGCPLPGSPGTEAALGTRCKVSS